MSNTENVQNPGVAPCEPKLRSVVRPRVDIVETDDSYVLWAEMPGVDQAGTEVTWEKDVLTVKGKAAPFVPEGFTRRFGSEELRHYERAFRISDDIDRGGIQAVVKNGILRVNLPKSREAAATRIAVQSG